MEKKKLDKVTKIGITISAISILVFVVVLIITNLQNNYYSTSTSNNVSKNENPYNVTNMYDGTYYFKLESTYNFWAIGIITFDNGKCEALYTIPSKIPANEKDYILNGYCGFDSNNNFIFGLNDKKYEYKCIKSENGFNCTSINGYDLTGNSNKDLTLTLLDNSENKLDFYSKFVKTEKENWKINVEQKEAEEKARKEAEEQAKKEAEEKAKAEEEQNFKASCQAYTYEQMARNPEKFKGTNVKLTGEVVQALYNSNSVDLRVNITKKGNYSSYYTDTVYITYNTVAGEDKILDDDIITIYGTAMGDYSYTSTIGAKITLPLISAKYITLEK
jgi:hypothetical protein